MSQQIARQRAVRDRRPTQFFKNTMESQSQSQEEESTGISCDDRTHTSEEEEMMRSDEEEAYSTDGVVNSSDSSLLEEIAQAKERDVSEEVYSEDGSTSESYSESASNDGYGRMTPRYNIPQHRYTEQERARARSHSNPPLLKSAHRSSHAKQQQPSPRHHKPERHSLSSNGKARVRAHSPPAPRSRSVDRSSPSSGHRVRKDHLFADLALQPPPMRHQPHPQQHYPRHRSSSYYMEEDYPTRKSSKHQIHYYERPPSVSPPRSHKSSKHSKKSSSSSKKSKESGVTKEAKQIAEYISELKIEVNTGDRKMKKVVQAMIDQTASGNKSFRAVAADLKFIKQNPVASITTPDKKTPYVYLYTWSTQEIPASIEDAAPTTQVVAVRASRSDLDFFKIPEECQNLRKLTSLYEKHATPEELKALEKRKDKKVARIDFLHSEEKITLLDVADDDVCDELVFSNRKTQRLASVIQAAAIRENNFVAITPSSGPPIPTKAAASLIVAANSIKKVIENFCSRTLSRIEKNKTNNTSPAAAKKPRNRAPVAKKVAAPTTPVPRKKTTKKQESEEEQQQQQEEEEGEEEEEVEVEQKKPKPSKKKVRSASASEEEEEAAPVKKSKKNDGEPEKKKRAPPRAKKNPVAKQVPVAAADANKEEEEEEKEGDMQVENNNEAAPTQQQPVVKKPLNLNDLYIPRKTVPTINAAAVAATVQSTLSDISPETIKKISAASIYDDEEDDAWLNEARNGRTAIQNRFNSALVK